MRWDESITKRAEVEKAIVEKRAIRGIYLICNTKDKKTEIMSMSEAFKKINVPLQLRVIGAAKGKDAAYTLLAQMCAAWLESHGSLDGFADIIG
ncbi:MAG: hypothetical protein IJR59_00110 [Firmicutes bacterium]|nr:hypothetical protein [Bacillota bacterium]